MDAADETAAFQRGEVAADGLGGDVEFVGQTGDIDPAEGPGPLEDGLLPLLCVHDVIVLSSVRVCAPGYFVSPLFTPD